MKKYNTNISFVEVSALLYYEPETGLLRHKVEGYRRAKGAVTGRLDVKGYVRVRLLGYEFKAHRLAWLLTHGTWPTAEIDHINGCTSDNRICNLRDVSTSENGWNRKCAMRNNKTGLLGVSVVGRNFHAQIGVKGVQHSLGVFDKAEDAHNAYLEAKSKLHAIP